ncbi:MAG TPA: helix-turn-helix transcriptional regulator [Ktedonobacteraceae bacterium]|jgi:transcriptional regulator with XRE-family HTH domain
MAQQQESLPLGQWIRQARIARGLSQAALAQRIGVDAKTIQRWEQGKQSPRPYSYSFLERELGRLPAAIQETAETGGASQVPEPDLFSLLYTILKPLPALDLREICHALEIDYQRLSGRSSAERAFSLVEEMQNHLRLDELRLALEKRYPRCLSSAP